MTLEERVAELERRLNTHPTAPTSGATLEDAVAGTLVRMLRNEADIGKVPKGAQVMSPTIFQQLADLQARHPADPGEALEVQPFNGIMVRIQAAEQRLAALEAGGGGGAQDGNFRRNLTDPNTGGARGILDVEGNEVTIADITNDAAAIRGGTVNPTGSALFKVSGNVIERRGDGTLRQLEKCLIIMGLDQDGNGTMKFMAQRGGTEDDDNMLQFAEVVWEDGRPRLKLD